MFRNRAEVALSLCAENDGLESLTEYVARRAGPLESIVLDCCIFKSYGLDR